MIQESKKPCKNLNATNGLITSNVAQIALDKCLVLERFLLPCFEQTVLAKCIVNERMSKLPKGINSAPSLISTKVTLTFMSYSLASRPWEQTPFAKQFFGFLRNCTVSPLCRYINHLVLPF